MHIKKKILASIISIFLINHILCQYSITMAEESKKTPNRIYQFESDYNYPESTGISYKDSNKQYEERSISLSTVAVVLSIAAGIYGLDIGYFKAERDQWTRVKNTYNGWVSLSGNNGKTLWFFKENGKYKHGWHWDSYYNGYYYFYNVEFVVGDATFSKVRWNANVMFDPTYNNRWLKLGNKWFEFELGGKLIHHEGWRKYNNKWLYHIPGNYGAIADGGMYIDGKWYNFDSNGYWV